MPRVKKKKEEKLQIEDIKKNPDIEKKHFINRFIEHEHEIMIWTTAFFMIAICAVVYIGMITIENKDKVEIYYDGNLKIRYNKDVSGVSDIIGLEKDNVVDLFNGKKAEFRFSITNDSLISSKYKVYLENDEAMIDLDECEEKLVNIDAIRYSINNKKEGKLKDLTENGFLIKTGSIKANTTKDYTLKVWIDKDSMKDEDNYHYHGKIIVVDAE